MKILIVDDDKDIRELIVQTLKSDGYELVTAGNGNEAMKVFDDSFDLVLLDVMMPFKDGITTCLEIRAVSTVPVIFLTAKVQDTDQVLGLTAGADDYIKKPFVPHVLQAKVKAVLRRATVFSNQPGSEKLDESIVIKNLEINERNHQVFMNGNEISLTKTEFDILLLLSKNTGQVFSAENIYDSVWGEESDDYSSNTVMVHVKKLRDKLKDKSGEVEYIKTVWGVGYKIEKV